MVSKILTVFTGSPTDEQVLEIGIRIAIFDLSEIHGLYVSAPADRIPDFRATRFHQLFLHRCEENNLSGEMAFVFGEKPIPQILRRAEFTNLIIIPISVDAISESYVIQFLRKSFRLTLLIPGEIPESLDTALHIHCNTLSDQNWLISQITPNPGWQIDIKISTILKTRWITGHQQIKLLALRDENSNTKKINRASIQHTEPIMQLAKGNDCDLIIFSGLEPSKTKRIFTGSVVNEILKNTKIPLLICEN